MQAVGGERARWGQLEHLVADVVDRLANLTYMTIAVNTKKSQRGRPPRPMPRPGVRDPHRPLGTASMTIAEAKAWKERRNGNREVARGS